MAYRELRGGATQSPNRANLAREQSRGIMEQVASETDRQQEPWGTWQRLTPVTGWFSARLALGSAAELRCCKCGHGRDARWMLRGFPEHQTRVVPRRENNPPSLIEEMAGYLYLLPAARVGAIKE